MNPSFDMMKELERLFANKAGKDMTKEWIDANPVLPWSKVEAYVFIEEATQEEWLVWGAWNNPDDPYTFDSVVDKAKLVIEAQTGLLPTDQIVVINRGDKLNFSRTIATNERGAKFGIPNWYLMKVER